jgi:carbamoyl-phosphate synthase large subunit
MQKNRLLITAVSGDIGSAAVRSFAAAGCEIIGCDIKPYTPVAHLLRRFYQSPTAAQGDEYIRCLKTIIEKEHITHLLPISEPEIEIIHLKRTEVRQFGATLVLNNEIILDNFLDKLKTVRYLDSIGIKTPKTILLDHYTNDLAYPFIVKPSKSCGSKGLWIVDDFADLEYVRRKVDGTFVAQEYIGSENDDYTTGIFSDGSVVSTISFRRKLGYGGLSAEVVLDDHPYLDVLAKKIARETNLVGSINLQSRRVDDVFIPYEINPRLSSTLLFRNKFGFDDAVWWVLVLSESSYSYKKQFAAGSAVRCFAEYFIDLQTFTEEQNIP